MVNSNKICKLTDPKKIYTKLINNNNNKLIDK